jgi:hypothetical protein
MARARLETVLLAMILTISAHASEAGQVDVIDVESHPSGDIWRFDVTVQHDDAGWDHYADRWEVLAPDGSVLGVRELLHPHVDEQPFTRSLSGVRIDPSIGQVRVRARDSLHGFAGESFAVELPR